MKITLFILIGLSATHIASAKPGESYILTGDEKSIAAIVDNDMTQYPELYKGEDPRSYLRKFKAENDIGSKRLQPGDPLLFPDTLASIKARNNSQEKSPKPKKRRKQKHPEIGKWKSVDYVQFIDDFKPSVQSWTEDLFLKDFTFHSGGSASMNWTWKDGWVLHSDEETKCQYFTKILDDQTYLFLPWMSGDVIFKGRKPWYYVFKRR